MTLSGIINKTVFLLILSIFTLEFISSEISWIPSKAKYLTELISIFILILSIVHLAFSKKLYVPGKYIFLTLICALTTTIGIIYNNLSSLEIIIGMRAYLKSVPLFILPIVYNFTEDQIKKQYKFIICLILIQFPIVIYQKFVKYATYTTGDVITGTMQVSSQLTIVTISAICILYTYYLTKRIELIKFLFISFIIFIPITMNETKITFFLIIIIFITPAIILDTKRISEKIRKFMVIILFGIIFMSIFIPTYNYFQANTNNESRLLKYLNDNEELKRYLYKGTHNAENQDVRRIDAIVIANQNIRKDFGTLIFGKGIGRVQDTKINIPGRKKEEISEYKADYITLSILLWETGYGGVVLFILFVLFLLKDSYYLKYDKGFYKSFGIAMFTNLSVFAICIIYTNFMQLHIMNYLFYFYSGVIVNRIQKIKMQRYAESTISY